MVEFALVIVPLLLLVIGMLQFGIVLNAKINETHLASSAARYAAVNQNPGAGTLQEYIKANADTQDMRDNATVCVEFPTNTETSTSGEVGDPVKVTMSYDYELLPLLGGVVMTIQGDATMRLEAVPDPDLVSTPCST